MGLQPAQYWALTPAEYWLMVQGYVDKIEADREYMRSLIYGAARFNAEAVAGAFSQEQAKAIGNVQFPWENDHQTNGTTDIGSWIMSWQNKN